jgi:UDP-N-acetylmuramate dehydrogenase
MLSLFMEWKHNIPLAPYTTVKIGGPAEHLIEATSYHQLKTILDSLKKNGVSTATILGNGSNTLISDNGIKGYVIINKSNEIELMDNNQIKSSSGVQLAKLIEFSHLNNLVGLESFAYIPSTVGGAISGNIHGKKFLFKELVISSEIIKLDNPIILSSIIQLKKGNVQKAKQEIKEIIKEKTKTQAMNSLGCIFKNTPELPAGLIIDKHLKLKGLCIGDAKISEKHANFIENIGHATAKDYYSLIKLIQSKAKEELNIDLDLEIKLLGQI